MKSSILKMYKRLELRMFWVHSDSVEPKVLHVLCHFHCYAAINIFIEIFYILIHFSNSYFIIYWLKIEFWSLRAVIAYLFTISFAIWGIIHLCSTNVVGMRPWLVLTKQLIGRGVAKCLPGWSIWFLLGFLDVARVLVNGWQPNLSLFLWICKL